MFPLEARDVPQQFGTGCEDSFACKIVRYCVTNFPVLEYPDDEKIHCQKTSKDRIGYAWAARLSPEASEEAAKQVAKGAKLIKTTDERWATGKARIKRFGGASLPPKDSENEKLLRLLFEMN